MSVYVYTSFIQHNIIFCNIKIIFCTVAFIIFDLSLYSFTKLRNDIDTVLLLEYIQKSN